MRTKPHFGIVDIVIILGVLCLIGALLSLTVTIMKYKAEERHQHMVVAP